MKKLKYLDKGLLFFCIVLFVIGLFMIFSASNVAAFMKMEKSPFIFLTRQVMWLGLGLLIFIAGITVHSKVFKSVSFPLLLAMIVALIYLLIEGQVINNARSWLRFGPLSLQPSEVIKVIFIVYIANYYHKNENKLNTYVKAMAPLGIALGISILILLQPDLGTTVIFILIVGFMFIISPLASSVKLRVILAVLGLSGVLLVGFLSSGKSLLREHQSQRLDLRSPCSEEKFYDHGNQLCNGYIAINNGGLFGKGLANSTQKYLYIPEAHTDFIFTIVVEELGAVISLLIILSIFIVIFRIVMIGKRALNNFHAMLSYGVAFYIFLHLVINLSGILGLLPMTGVPLPFLSYGGSFTLSLIAGLAMVQKVNIETRMKTSRK